MPSDTITRLDVRAILANGGEPFDLIIETAAQISAALGHTPSSAPLLPERAC